MKEPVNLNPEAAKNLGIPLNYWKVLQKGECVTTDGITYRPEQVMGPARKGIKVTYCTDTRPMPVIADKAKGSDYLYVKECTVKTAKKLKPRKYKHMTMYEAAKIAKEAEVPKLWLTHYSPSMTRPEEFMEDVRKIFPATYAAKDGWTMELKFDEGE